MGARAIKLTGWAVIVVMTLPASMTPRAETLEIATEEAPPFNMIVGGKLIGLSTEILEQALGHTTITYKIAVYPWLRAYDNALRNDKGCVFSTNRTKEREPMFKWVGPLTDDQLVVFARADSHIRLDSIDDMKPYRIGTYEGDFASTLLKEHGLTVDEAILDQLNVKKLQLGRIDLWVSSLYRKNYLTKRQAGADFQQLLILSSQSVYLACNKNVSDGIINELNFALQQMTREGAMAKIMQNYR